MAKNTFYRNEPLTILLVEDNLDHADLVKRAMAEHRVPNRVVHVQDGQMALDYLLHQGQFLDPASSVSPNVVLLDLRLPKVDGLEVLRTIKKTESLCSIPVVILTSSEADRDIACAYEYRANSYLVKPVDYDDFRKMLETFGYYWLGWNLHPY